MSKKIIAGILCLSMVFSLFGCTSETPAKDGTYTAGTYLSTMPGNNGPIDLKVELSADSILSVSVESHSETAGIATPVLDTFPSLITEGQTLNIDAVTGATETSKAILDGVADCVTQAGGDVEALKNKAKTEQTAGEAIVKTADIIIIGAGGAGLAAAVSASENGASVIIIEKGAAVGGNTLRAGGAYNAVDAERQNTLPMDESQIAELKSIAETDPSTIAEEYRQTLETLKSQIAKYLAGDTSILFDSTELHTYQTYLSGRRTGMDKTEIYGEYELVNKLTSESLDGLNWVVSQDSEVGISDNIGTVLGGLWPRMHGLTTEVGHGFIDPLLTAAEANGAELMLNTKGEKLILENGRVVGVEAVQTDGTLVTLTATKGVIITTGGYGANPQMAIDHDNYWGVLKTDMPTTNSALLTGDGIVMGEEAGASLVGMGYIQLMPSSQPVTGSLGGGLWTGAEEQVFVNLEGKRFVSEYESRDVLALAALEQTDGTFYIICDQESAGDPQPGGKNGWGNDIDALIEEGSVLKADTLEELAKQIGCDPAVLVAEIDKYNGFSASGVDGDFGKVKIGKPIDIGPFYATVRTPSIHHTMGGLKINANTEVIGTDDNIIPGLYAAGEVTGGIHAGNRVGGNALPDIIVFGKTAGEVASSAKSITVDNESSEEEEESSKAA